MTLTLEPQPVPLAIDQDGEVRVGGTRITLHSVVVLYERGETVEGIVSAFESLTPSVLHAVLAYYHAHPDEVREYMRRYEEEAEELRRELSVTCGQEEFRGRILARKAEMERGCITTDARF